MFLPGIEASELYASGSPFENHIWLPNSPFNQDVPSLDLTNSAAANNVYTKEKDVLGNAYGVYGVYDSFVNQMNNLATGANPLMNAWEPIAYDWRLDYNQLLTQGNDVNGNIYYRGTNATTSTPYIIQELKKLAASSRTGKVTIIAHSNGGLLAKALIQYLGTTTAQQLVDKVVMVATPQLGTPETIVTILHGADQALPFEVFPIVFNNADARYLSLSTPVSYNLLPSQQYQNNALQPLISIDPASLPDWVQKYGSVIVNSQKLRSFLTDTSRGASSYSDIATPAIASTSLFDSAAATHSQLDNWTPPQGIKLITIAGWGNPTTSSINYEKLPWYQCAFVTLTSGITTPSNCSATTRITYTPQSIVDGDGTVVDTSAEWANGTSSTRYWVDLNAINKVFGVSKPSFLSTKHADIFQVSQLRTLLVNLLANSSTSTLPQYISNSRPVYTGTDPRLYFFLHSPLTLGFVDSSGNYTGSTATTSIFNVPGVDYERIGEVQWLSVPKSLAGQVALHATGTGSFTLDVQNVNGNNILATTSFVGIPNATSTIATLAIDPSVSPTASSNLKVDFNGDGIIDTTLHSKDGGVVLPDFVPPEAIISVSTSTKDISVLGIDDVSSTTTVNKTATTTTITDQSGNATTLYFNKTYTNNLLTYARLTGINYGTATIALPTSFLYVWNTSKTLVSQTVVADNIFAIEALYNKVTNKTTIIVLKKNTPIQTTTVTGLAVIKLTTSKGAISYSW